MQSLFAAEGQVLLYIQDHLRCAALNGPVTFITHLGDAGIFWIVLTALLLCFKKTRRVGIFCAAAIVLNFITANIFLKNIIHRTRPYEVIDSLKILVSPEHDFSFPSGHTACSFAAAWAIWKNAPKKYGAAALVLAVLIALSRLYVGVHYPTDVLGGAAVGILSACSAQYALASFKAKKLK